MKNQLFIFIILFQFSSSGQYGWKIIKGNGVSSEETRSTSTYESVKVSGSIDVKFIEGAEGNILVEAEENLLQFIETSVQKGKLIICAEKGKNLRSSRGQNIVITVPIEEINAVSLGGSGSIRGSNTLKTASFDVSLAGSGDIELNVESNHVQASVAGSGDLSITGTANTWETSIAGSGDINLRGLGKTLDVSIAGSGDLEAQNLETTNVNISISGSGDAKINCDGGELNVNTVGSGDVYFLGNPKHKNIRNIGSGKTKAL